MDNVAKNMSPFFDLLSMLIQQNLPEIWTTFQSNKLIYYIFTNGEKFGSVWYGRK